MEAAADTLGGVRAGVSPAQLLGSSQKDAVFDRRREESRRGEEVFRNRRLPQKGKQAGSGKSRFFQADQSLVRYLPT